MKPKSWVPKGPSPTHTKALSHISTTHCDVSKSTKMSWLFCGLEHHSVLRTRRMFPMALWTGRRLRVENNLELSAVSPLSWLYLLIKPRLEVRFPVPSPLSLPSLSVFPLRVAVHAAITTNISIFEREILQHFILALSLNSCSFLRNRSGEWLMTFLVEGR